MERDGNIPDSVRAVLWSYDVERIDPDLHKRLIICQVLNFGTEDAVKWLSKLYGRGVVTRIADDMPLGQWDKKSLSLWSLILGVKPVSRTHQTEARGLGSKSAGRWAQATNTCGRVNFGRSNSDPRLLNPKIRVSSDGTFRSKCYDENIAVL